MPLALKSCSFLKKSRQKVSIRQGKNTPSAVARLARHGGDGRITETVAGPHFGIPCCHPSSQLLWELAQLVAWQQRQDIAAEIELRERDRDVESPCIMPPDLHHRPHHFGPSRVK